MEITTRDSQGRMVHAYQAKNADDARSYMLRNSVATHVDGWTVEGIGIVRIIRTLEGDVVGFSRLVDGEFVTGGAELLPA